MCCSNDFSWLVLGLDWNHERMVWIGLVMVYNWRWNTGIFSYAGYENICCW
jgi:hypothetical protein